MPGIHKLQKEDYQNLETSAILEMLVQETLSYTHMLNQKLTEGISVEAFEACKANINELQNEIESRDQSIPPDKNKLLNPYKY